MFQITCQDGHTDVVRSLLKDDRVRNSLTSINKEYSI